MTRALSFTASSLCILGALTNLGQALPRHGNNHYSRSEHDRSWSSANRGTYRGSPYPTTTESSSINYDTTPTTPAAATTSAVSAIAWQGGIRVYAVGATPSVTCPDGQIMEIQSNGASGTTAPTFSTNSNPCLSPPDADTAAAFSASTPVDGNDTQQGIMIFYFTNDGTISGYMWTYATNSWQQAAFDPIQVGNGPGLQNNVLASTGYISNGQSCYSVYYLDSGSVEVADVCNGDLILSSSCTVDASGITGMQAISYLLSGSVVHQLFITSDNNVQNLVRSDMTQCSLTSQPDFTYGVGAPYVAFVTDSNDSGPENSLSVNYIDYSTSPSNGYTTSTLDWSDSLSSSWSIPSMDGQSSVGLSMAVGVYGSTNYPYGFLWSNSELSYFWQNSNSVWSDIEPVVTN